MTNVLFIRDVLYRLKQDYGQRMDLYIPSKSSVNFESGKQDVTRKRYVVKKVVLLPEILQRRLIQEVALLAGGRNFAYGGFLDEGKRSIILDGKDIPKGVKIDATCYFIYNHVRYDLDKIEELEHRCAFVATMKQVNTSPPLEIMDLSTESPLQWTQIVEIEL